MWSSAVLRFRGNSDGDSAKAETCFLFPTVWIVLGACMELIVALASV